jgi:glucose-1-phosphatase
MLNKKDSLTNIKAILFDLGKVIVDFNFEPAFRRLSKASVFRPEEIRDYFLSSGLEVVYDGGKISSKVFYLKVKNALKHQLTYAQFKKVWNEVFKPNRPVVSLIRRLRARYRLVLISNTNAMHYEYIRSKYNIFNSFHKLILSFKVKIRKPDAEIYKKAALACRAKPSEIFYIDDRSDLTEAASELGFNTFTFKKNPGALVAALKRHGVRV